MTDRQYAGPLSAVAVSQALAQEQSSPPWLQSLYATATLWLPIPYHYPTEQRFIITFIL